MNQLPAWLPAVVRDAHGAWFVTAGVVLGVVAAAIIVRALSRRSWRSPWLVRMRVVRPGTRGPRCQACGYSMVGNDSLRCPECGHVAVSGAELMRRRRRPMVAVLVAVVLLPMAVVMLWVPGWREGGPFRALPTSVVMMLERAVGVERWPELTWNVRGRLSRGRLGSPWQLQYYVLHHDFFVRFRDRWPRGVAYRLEVTSKESAATEGMRVVAPTFVPPTEADRSYFESFLMPVKDRTIEARLVDGRLPLKAMLVSTARRPMRELTAEFYVPITLVGSLAEAMTPVRSGQTDAMLTSALRLRFADVTEMSADESQVTPMWRMLASVPMTIAGTLPTGTVLAVRVEVVDASDGDRVLATSQFRFEPGYLQTFATMQMPVGHRVDAPGQSVVKGDMSFFRAVARGERDAASLAIRITPDEMGALTAFGATAYWDGEIRLPLMPTIAGLKPTKKVAE